MTHEEARVLFQTYCDAFIRNMLAPDKEESHEEKSADQTLFRAGYEILIQDDEYVLRPATEYEDAYVEVFLNFSLFQVDTGNIISCAEATLKITKQKKELLKELSEKDIEFLKSISIRPES
ncbi:MAG: hypothetical protein A2934_02855 [Candidatus Sungbacteria bacterium RIFCSPLOWO2_01_FULL_47_10]|uniref:Uncharacterized protein n=1 Tax=Candidatus Sungbacteria bacterium RIFCSPLOWO2_01_FULL_47_10 TaxID=1802276 RepID=A0A1G2LAH9_9BACT|nr:MAG: hypothetical protein A2934_02855 [Candidatus Sungbacteria bacterium RIFCSPLOWO2_01_FULL_47_10]